MAITTKGRGWTAARLLAVAIAAVAPLSSAAVAPRQLVEVADISGPVVSPDGRQVAFRVERASIERNTYDTVWYVQDLQTRAPQRRVADGGTRLHDVSGVAIPAVAHWSPDGQSIFFRASLDGKVDVWRAAADGSGAKPMTLDPADVRDFALSKDGAVLRYAVGATRGEIVQAEQDEYDHGVHVDASVPIGQGLFRSGYNSAGRLATQRFMGVGFGRDELLAGTPDHWKVIRLGEGQGGAFDAEDSGGPGEAAIRQEYGQARPERAMDPRSGRRAVLSEVGPEGSQRTELSVMSAENGRPPVRCSAVACTTTEINSVQWRPGQAELLFTTSSREEGWAQTVHRWNPETGAVVEVARSSGFINGGRERASSCGISPEVLVCVVAGPVQPPRLEEIDIEAGTRRVLLAPNEGLQYELEQSVISRFIRWVDAKGEVFTGHLFVARGQEKTPLPLFVTYYSCAGFLRGGMGDEWPLASLAQSGIASLCINALPHQPDPFARYDQGISALESIVAQLAEEGVVDPSKVGMGGLSFGSEVALWAATESDLLVAASVTSPSVSPLLYLMASNQGERYPAALQASWGLDAPDATPQRWQRLSPACNWERIAIPVLFQMPENEYMYALDYVLPMVHDYKADLYVFPHEKHQKFQPRHKLAAYQRNLEWFGYWLLGVETQAARSNAQYSRWREMRQHLQARGVPAKGLGSASAGGAPSSPPCKGR